jgi:SET domain-containing protein
MWYNLGEENHLINKMAYIDYPKAKYELRGSKIVLGQVGLFSLRDFSVGDIVIPASNWDEGKLISWDEYEKIDSLTKRQLIYFCFKTKEGIYVPGDINKINIGYFSNHSCDPLLLSNEKGDYVAIKKINNGDELTIDVEALMEKTIFSFECNCGSVNCRKIIKI